MTALRTTTAKVAALEFSTTEDATPPAQIISTLTLDALTPATKGNILIVPTIYASPATPHVSVAFTQAAPALALDAKKDFTFSREFVELLVMLEAIKITI